VDAGDVLRWLRRLGFPWHRLFSRARYTGDGQARQNAPGRGWRERCEGRARPRRHHVAARGLLPIEPADQVPSED
jgi:hypothetical protein